MGALTSTPVGPEPLQPGSPAQIDLPPIPKPLPLPRPPTTLNFDIWLQVLPYLGNPTPLPLSHPPRSQMKQHQLTIAARVCKASKPLVERLLYTHVTTDNFPYLVYGVQVRAKRRLLGLIQTLRVEYKAKSEWGGGDPIYEELMLGKTADRLGPIWASIGNLDCREMLECDFECEKFLTALDTLNEMGFGNVFTRLQSLAVASIYGTATGSWKRYEACSLRHGWSRRLGPIHSCVRPFETLLASGQIRHFCTREINGPLSTFSRSDRPSRLGGPECTRTVHFDSASGPLPLILGTPGQRWVSDSPPTEDMTNVLFAFGDRLRRIAAKDVTTADHQREPLTLDIYCSTSRHPHGDLCASLPVLGHHPFQPSDEGYEVSVTNFAMRKAFRPPPADPSTLSEVDAEGQALFSSMLGEVVQDHFRSTTGADDVVRWHSSLETPTCLACGSGVPA